MPNTEYHPYVCSKAMHTCVGNLMSSVIMSVIGNMANNFLFLFIMLFPCAYTPYNVIKIERKDKYPVISKNLSEHSI